MSTDATGRLPFDAPLAAYEREADLFFAALRARDTEAAWSVRWEHPAFKGQDVRAVFDAPLTPEDARLVIACKYAFDGWAQLAAFSEAVAGDTPVRRFESCVEAVVSGDLSALREALAEDRALPHARSTRRHHATLLHYVAANGVEGARQKTPANVLDIAAALLDAGADPDALADMYDQRCTTLSMLVSSSPPAAAGLQLPLAQLLVDRGARVVGPGTGWPSALLTALTFGFVDTARALSERPGVPVGFADAAGLGRLDEVLRGLPGADAPARHVALALAAQHGHAAVVGALLDAGEDPDRFNPAGLHAHATPLHQAALADHLDVVGLLVERGARLDIRDTIYHATPLGWAEFKGAARTVEFLRARGAPR